MTSEHDIIVVDDHPLFRRGVGIAGCRTEVDHICPLGHQLTRLRNGCVWRQIPASIGETVRGYVDDAENDRTDAPEIEQRTTI